MNNFKQSVQTRWNGNSWFVVCKKGLFSVKNAVKADAENEAKIAWQDHVDAGDYDEVETVSMKAAKPVNLATSINKALHPRS